MLGRKGMMLSMEAVIAVSIILIALAAMMRYSDSSVPNVSDQKAYIAIKNLDDRGELRKYAYSDNLTMIKTKLSTVLGDRIDITLCENCSSFPVGSDVRVLEYYMSGYKGYSPKKLFLYVWN
jgi:hypothetical protein